jgi:hypothetical protein
VGCHFSVVLARNRVRRLFRTFFKHASTFNKVLSIGHRAPPCEAVTTYVIIQDAARIPDHGLLIFPFASALIEPAAINRRRFST